MKAINSRRWIGFLLWIFILFFLWLALKDVDWTEVRTVLAAITPRRAIVLVLINIGIVFLLGSRWWLILWVQGYRIPFEKIAGYRLAAFAVSYFTPGPHFGGEPLQALLLVRRENVPPAAATASVLLDKLFELAFNFGFLWIGVIALITGGLIPGAAVRWVVIFSFLLVCLIVLYLFSLMLGQSPVANFIDRLQGGSRFRLPGRYSRLINHAEHEAGEFVQVHRDAFFLAVLLSAIIWVVLILEFVLAIKYLGLDIQLIQVVQIMAAARIANLLPLPGGLGALEIAMVVVTQAVGGTAALGAGLSLLIRFRDVGFGLMGLWIGRKVIKPREILEEG